MGLGLESHVAGHGAESPWAKLAVVCETVVQFPNPISIHVVDNAPEAEKWKKSSDGRFGSPLLWQHKPTNSGHSFVKSRTATSSGPWSCGLNLRTVPFTRVSTRLTSADPPPASQATKPTCSSPSPSHSHRCLRFDKDSGHTGLWSRVASCGLPWGLCPLLTASVGWADLDPGCRGRLSLTRPVQNLLLKPAAPGLGERGLVGTALCL